MKYERYTGHLNKLNKRHYKIIEVTEKISENERGGN